MLSRLIESCEARRRGIEGLCGAPVRVLVVLREDSPLLKLGAESELQRRGFEVVVARKTGFPHEWRLALVGVES